MLRFDADGTQNQSYVLLIILGNIAYQSGDQYPTSIHPRDSDP